MEIECKECNESQFELTIHELGVMGQKIVYSALKCKGCGMVYPLAELGRNVSKASIASMLHSG